MHPDGLLIKDEYNNLGTFGLLCFLGGFTARSASRNDEVKRDDGDRSCQQTFSFTEDFGLLRNVSHLQRRNIWQTFPDEWNHWWVETIHLPFIMQCIKSIITFFLLRKQKLPLIYGIPNQITFTVGLCVIDIFWRTDLELLLKLECRWISFLRRLLKMLHLILHVD